MKEKFALWFPVVCLFFVLACPPSPKSSPDASDAKVGDNEGVIFPPTNVLCTQMCPHLRDLKCPEGFGVDGGASCEAVCDKQISIGAFDFKPQCVIATKDVSGVQACGMKCQ